MLSDMLSRYDEAEAARYVARFSENAPEALLGREAREDLALRVYTSQLLGREASLVLHGGGNTSVKTRAQELTGEALEVLCIKGSGWDLAHIEPPGFPMCRQKALLALCQLAELSDEDMLKGLKGQMLDPGSPTPSVEALLHAFLPAKFVDHTHADAVLALVDQPDAELSVRRVFGDAALFVPYVMPGFVLLRRVVELMRERPPACPMVLEKHGIFTWGTSARESYERMILAVTQAEDYLRAQGAALDPAPALPASTLSPSERRVRQRALTPAVRGALYRAVEGQRFLLKWQDDPATLALAAHPDAQRLTQLGPMTPDHVIRTKARPLFVARADAESPDSNQKLTPLFTRYRDEYLGYFERGAARSGQKLKRLDSLPRLLVVPELGALCVGETATAAGIVRDIYRHTSRVLLAATRLGRYEPVSEADLFDVEYWSLEQAKLKQASKAGAFKRHVVLVTGAARGIGLATARAFLAKGAHVFLSDRDPVALEASAQQLARDFDPSLTTHLAANVSVPEEVEQVLVATLDAFGGVDVVVSNAGTAPQGLLHDAAGDRALRESLEVNLLGHQNVARASSELMLAQGMGGVLLFNASKSAFNPGPEFGPYAVAKSALVALMKQYAVDLAPHGIRAAAVNADRVRTDLFGGGVLEARARARGISPDAYFKLNLLGRETLAADVADAFCWLAEAPATTGAVVPVDGGNPAAFPR